MNSFDKDKIFLKLSNEKKSDSNVNLTEKITKGERYFRQLFKKAFGKETITQKPETLKALENKLKSYFFGKDGSLIYLIPKLRNHIIHEERQKIDKLDKKIEIGDLTYLNLSYQETINLDKRLEINKKRKELLLSSNYTRTNKFHNNRNIKLRKEKNNFNLTLLSNPKNRIKINKSLSPIENSLNKSSRTIYKYIKTENSEDDSNKYIAKLPHFIKSTPKKSQNNTINTSNNSTYSSYYPLNITPDSNRIQNLKNSKNNIFSRKRNKINLLNFSSEKKDKIEQYTIKKPIIYNSYFRTSYKGKIKNSTNNIKSFRDGRKEIFDKIDKFHRHEIKLSKSLYDLVGNNKKNKLNKLKKDIEIIFDHKIEEKKEISIKEMINDNKKDNDENFQKNTILNGINNLSNNHLTKLVKNKSIKKIIKGRDLLEEIKLTQFLLNEDNKKLQKIRNKVKQQMKLIKVMSEKVNSEHSKLKNQIKKNEEKEKYLKEKQEKDYIHYIKTEKEYNEIISKGKKIK